MSADRLSLRTQSPAGTEALGGILLDLAPDGSLIALRGELGTGKTCLVRGMAAHLRLGDEIVSSPTYTLVNEYGSDRKLYHLDLYRVTSAAEVIDLGCEELFDPDDGLCVIEWAERAESLLPRARIDITLQHAGDDTRDIAIENTDILSDGWQELVRRVVGETGETRADSGQET